jgi:hypothetical protein
VIRRDAQADQRDIGTLTGCHGADRRHVDLAGDHVVAEPGEDLRQELETVTPLIRDQDA